MTSRPSLSLAKVAGLATGAVALLGFSVPYLPQLPSPLLSFVPGFPILEFPLSISFRTSNQPTQDFICEPHTYQTELVSLDPLVIYIHSFLAPREIDALLVSAEPNFRPSLVSKAVGKVQTPDRTSWSAGLPRGDPAAECVLARSRAFLGTMLRDDWDDMGPPQLVRYTAGQRFNLHHDWFDIPVRDNDGSSRTWNRVASFFAILQDNCTEGETHFPYIRGIAGPNPWETDGDGEQDGNVGMVRPWRNHEEGGLAFRPIKGNAIFWVNLFANGTGDNRVIHAGLPLGDGLKTAMNIWPRQYYRG